MEPINVTGSAVHYASDVIVAAVARGRSAAGAAPRSGDTRKSAGAYVEMNEHLRRGTWKYLQDDDDLPQASNKAWGLVAKTVKAISAQYGGIIHTHRVILLITSELSRVVRESGDTAAAAWINNSFGRARTLHANFYANFYKSAETTGQVADGVQLSAELSARLYDLFWPDLPTAGASLTTEVEPSPVR